VLERRIATWPELQDVLEDLANAGWAFRGQSDSTWPLESSLTRYLKSFRDDRNDWPDRERHILHTFKRKAHLLLPRTPEPGETLEWLALMQHHGAPTRLLDFSWSPYVAAFFAVERATANAAIWAICSGRHVPNNRGYAISETLNAVIRPEILEQPGLVFPKTEGKIPRAMIGEPVLMNQRMITQAGTFLIPGQRIDVSLDSLIPRDSLLKLTLETSALRRDTMNNLYGMNINNAALFPGIDGLARSMGFELEYDWHVDPGAAERLTRRRARVAGRSKRQ